jgi:uncharacterized membrane protein
MKKIVKILVFTMPFIFYGLISNAQCSICTKTASQIGEEAGRGFNAGILYLAAMPFGIMGYIAFRWWKSEQQK